MIPCHPFLQPVVKDSHRKSLVQHIREQFSGKVAPFTELEATGVYGLEDGSATGILDLVCPIFLKQLLPGQEEIPPVYRQVFHNVINASVPSLWLSLLLVLLLSGAISGRRWVRRFSCTGIPFQVDRTFAASPIVFSTVQILLF